MAPLQDSSPKKVLVLCLALVFVSSVFICAYSTEVQAEKNELFFGRRRMLELQDEDEQPIIKQKSSATTATTSLLSTKGKNQTKLVKATTSSSSKNQTKLIKTGSVAAKNQTKLLEFPSESTKKSNQTKLIKPVSDSSTLEEKNPTVKIPVKKLNSTSSKSSNSTKTSTFLSKKSADLTTTSSSKNKTAKARTTTSKDSKTLLDKNLSNEPKSKSKTTTATSDTEKPSDTKPKSEKSPKQTLPRWIDQDDDDDLVSGFRDLPSKFQETLIPDLERISKTSKVYLNKANKEITRGFKPIVGNKYAPTIASFTSFAFLLIPLILVSLIFNKFKAYFSLQKILIFIQIYMSIYFSILCLSSLVTGLEPLRFFYATSQSTYVCLQVLQTLGYVLYLLLLLMYLILVFSTETGLATKLLGLGQTFVGFAIGLHYYMMVFHRAVLHQPPKTTWKVHAVYATCFLLICLLTRADRRKKAYLEGGAEGKLS